MTIKTDTQTGSKSGAKEGILSVDEAKRLAQVAMNYAQGKVDGIEVHLLASNIATSRFANNSMTQNQAPERLELSVRIVKDGRQARLSTESKSDQAICELVDKAIQASSFLEKDPDLMPLVTPKEIMSGKVEQSGKVSKFNPDTAEFSPSQRAEVISAMIDVGKKNNLSVAGVYATGQTVECVANSQGVFAYHNETSAECSVTMVAPDSTGWAKMHSFDHNQVDGKALAEIAAQKAIASAKPVDIEPGHYTVILEPSATLDLLSFLWYDFAATSHVDKLSCFMDKLGQKVLGANINVVDDVYHSLQTGSPFSGEGIPRQRVSLVEGGVLKNLVYGRRSASKLGKETTGHGFCEPNPMGEQPMNIVMTGGNSSVEKMIAGSKRAILLTRVWYVREVDPTAKIVTGMTRDGTFLVEDGKVKSGVKNLRFNVGLIDLLNNVVELGQAIRTAGEEGIPAVVPAIKVENFNFTSSTTF